MTDFLLYQMLPDTIKFQKDDKRHWTGLLPLFNGSVVLALCLAFAVRPRNRQSQTKPCSWTPIMPRCRFRIGVRTSGPAGRATASRGDVVLRRSSAGVELPLPIRVPTRRRQSRCTSSASGQPMAPVIRIWQPGGLSRTDLDEPRSRS